MKINLLEKIKGNAVLRSISILVSGNIIGRLIALFTLPIVSRLYSLEDFGENGVITATAGIIVNLGGLGLNSAVMAPDNDKESSIVFNVAFYSASFIYLFLFVVVLFLSPWYELVKTSLPYILTCLLIFLLAFSSQLNSLLNIYVNRKGMNRLLFNNSIISAVSTLFITIPLGVMSFGVIGLVGAALISGLVCAIQMVYYTNPFKEKIYWRDFITVFRKYKDFIFYQYPSNAIGGFASQYSTRFLSSNFGNEKLGTYNMNDRILGIPLNLLAVPISTIYFRTASQQKNQLDQLARFTYRLIKNIMLVSIIPIVVLALWGEELFGFILGSEWSAAGKMASVLVIQYVFNFCSDSISYCRVTLNRQKLNLWVVVIRLILSVFSLFVGIYMYKDLFDVVVLFSITMTLFFIIDMALNFYSMQRYIVRYLIFSVVYALSAFVLVFLVG
jgi:O-antigen/teichoic acid export membrane protein